MKDLNSCKYCDLAYQKSQRTVLENGYFFANFDKHPVSPGHMKLIPKRHANSLSELTDDEMVALRDILKASKELVEARYRPDGYNIGVNEGEAAGQTVFHLHIHLIPRYRGDIQDPVGGVRNITPGRGNYLLVE